jgi:hypothetical protein
VRGVNVEAVRGTFEFIKRGAIDHDSRMTVDAVSAQWVVDGVPTNLMAYLDTWLALERDRRLHAFQSEPAEEGLHQVGLAFEREFAFGKATPRIGVVLRCGYARPRDYGAT